MTTEELAKKYMDADNYKLACLAINHCAQDLATNAFIAGYEAKEREDRLKLAELHSYGSEPQQIAAAWVKQRGSTHQLALIEESAFINGYLIAKQEK